MPFTTHSVLAFLSALRRSTASGDHREEGSVALARVVIPAPSLPGRAALHFGTLKHCQSEELLLNTFLSTLSSMRCTLADGSSSMADVVAD